MNLLYYVLPILCMPAFVTGCSKRYLKLVLFVGFILAGFRQDVIGYDYRVYEQYYNGLIVAEYEPGFNFLVYIFKHCDLSFTALLLTISALNNLSLYFLLNKLRIGYSINALLLLFFYVVSGGYFWFAYTLTRQSIAISIYYLMLAFFCVHGKFMYKKCITSVGVASLFHIGGLVNSLPLFINSERTKIRYLITIGTIITIIGCFAIFFIDTFAAKYTQYADADAGLGLYGTVEAIALLIVTYFAINDTFIKRIVYVSIIFIILCYCIYYMTGLPVVRFAEPFKLFLYIPLVYSYQKLGQQLRIAIAIFLIPIALYRLHLFITMFGDDGYPYRIVNIFTS